MFICRLQLFFDVQNFKILYFNETDSSQTLTRLTELVVKTQVGVKGSVPKIFFHFLTWKSHISANRSLK
jgi:hypothetical protein